MPLRVERGARQVAKERENQTAQVGETNTEMFLLKSKQLCTVILVPFPQLNLQLDILMQYSFGDFHAQSYAQLL